MQASIRFLLVTAIALVAELATAQDISILAWNIESGGSDPAVIEKQLEDMRGTFNILALSEVPATERNRFGRFFSLQSFIATRSGGNKRTLIAWDADIYEMVTVAELREFNWVELATDGQRAPLIATLRVKADGSVFQVINNHLARSNDVQRRQQATALVDYARIQNQPVIAVGDYNMDYDFHTNRGNDAFGAMLEDGIFQWVKPAELIDTNWADGNSDGRDDYPDSMLDFTFTAQTDWQCSVKVIVRPGDFPDDDTTSDHRPMLSTISRQPK